MDGTVEGKAVLSVRMEPGLGPSITGSFLQRGGLRCDSGVWEAWSELGGGRGEVDEAVTMRWR